MKKKLLTLSAFFLLIISFPGCRTSQTASSFAADSLQLIFNQSLKHDILDKWYPLVIDSADGGYFSNLSFDWKISANQPKMLVSQSRHVWTSSQAALFYQDTSYTRYARHGYLFLKDHMWDTTYGGFFNLRSKNGGFLDQSYRNEKRAYGNTFAIYGLTSLYTLTKDTAVLNLAKKTFLWLENHSHDKKYGEYMDIMDQDGRWTALTHPEDKTGDHRVAAWKDYNSSIHLLEAFTDLYKIWPDPLVRTRLLEMFSLLRDTFITEKGYLTLYFTTDWKPVSNRDSTEDYIRKNSALDHVSFGHDVETAFLLLEASHTLGIENDTTTLRVAKKLVDHSLATGFDKKYGGFFYEGYYFKGRDTMKIINTEKSWWVQAEGLNALLMMSAIYPSESRYRDAFLKQWEHINRYVMDKQYGDWFISGLDYNPEARTAPKASVWKVNYHNGRAFMNCIRTLRNENQVVKAFSNLSKGS